MAPRAIGERLPGDAVDVRTGVFKVVARRQDNATTLIDRSCA
jgi:hypothetical protein